MRTLLIYVGCLCVLIASFYESTGPITATGIILILLGIVSDRSLFRSDSSWALTPCDQLSKRGKIVRFIWAWSLFLVGGAILLRIAAGLTVLL